MRLPGFTAESSLSETSSYRQRAAEDRREDRAVVPAACGQDYEGPCINGWQWICFEGGYPRRVPCLW